MCKVYCNLNVDVILTTNGVKKIQLQEENYIDKEIYSLGMKKYGVIYNEI